VYRHGLHVGTHSPLLHPFEHTLPQTPQLFASVSKLAHSHRFLKQTSPPPQSVFARHSTQRPVATLQIDLPSGAPTQSRLLLQDTNGTHEPSRHSCWAAQCPSSTHATHLFRTVLQRSPDGVHSLSDTQLSGGGGRTGASTGGADASGDPGGIEASEGSGSAASLLASGSGAQRQLEAGPQGIAAPPGLQTHSQAPPSGETAGAPPVPESVCEGVGEPESG
jgi:hypothetical protein